MKIQLISVLLIVFSLMNITNANADKIYMSNGDILSGRIISFDNNLCVFETKYDSIAKIYPKNIIGIDTTEKYKGKLSSDETINMRLSFINNKTIAHTDYGDISIEPNMIKSLTRIIVPNKKENITDKNSHKYNKDDVSNNSENEYGKNKKKDAPLDFLTGSTVLLSPGSWQADFGISYKNNKSSYPLPQIDQFQMSTFEARKIDLTLGLRAGLIENLEGWLSVPFSYIHVKDVSTNDFVRSDSTFRIGDIQGGLQYALVHETPYFPSVTANISVSAPTGEKRYLEYVDSWRNALSNGSGHWTLMPGLSFVKRTDPAILFAGINYQYAFNNTIDGYDIQPGWGINGYFGVGFALNEELSLGTRLSFGYYDDMYVDGVRIEGSSTEPLDLGFTLSYRLADDIVMTPYINFGINDDAGPAAVGVNFTKSF